MVARLPSTAGLFRSRPVGFAAISRSPETAAGNANVGLPHKFSPDETLSEDAPAI